MNHLIACTRVGFSHVPASLACHSFLSSFFFLFLFSFCYSVGLFSSSPLSLFPFSPKAPSARLRLQPLHPVSSCVDLTADCQFWSYLTQQHLSLLLTSSSLLFLASGAPSQLGEDFIGMSKQNLFSLISKCQRIPSPGSLSSSLLQLHPLTWWTYLVSGL